MRPGCPGPIEGPGGEVLWVAGKAESLALDLRVERRCTMVWDAAIAHADAE